MQVRIKRAEFVAGAQHADQFPELTLPEVAVVGRSNVGKSTLINKLCARRSLARASSTPGRTQQVNFFDIVLLDQDNREYNFTLVDLPGYGFAKLSKDRREELSKLTVQYVSQRDNLKLVLLLTDSRRDAGAEELAVHDLAFNAGRMVQIVATKTDKLHKRELAPRLEELAKGYGLEASDIIGSSDEKDAGDIWVRILEQL